MRMGFEVTPEDLVMVYGNEFNMHLYPDSDHVWRIMGRLNMPAIEHMAMNADIGGETDPEAILVIQTNEAYREIVAQIRRFGMSAA